MIVTEIEKAVACYRKADTEIKNGMILLAADAMHKNGRRVESEAFRHIPNDHVIETAKMDGRIFLGASVHPYRDAKSAHAETMRCISAGAVLFNWLPAVQEINPQDDRCVPLYLNLIREEIPLLVHYEVGSAGREGAGHFYDPCKLTGALDYGLKVMVSLSPANVRQVPPSDDRVFNEFIGMLSLSAARKWDLYADITGLVAVSGFPYLEKIRQELDNGRIGPERIVGRNNLAVRQASDFFCEMSLENAASGRTREGCGQLPGSGLNKLETFDFDVAAFTDIRKILRMCNRPALQDRH